jgi:hypothetical protein
MAARTGSATSRKGIHTRSARRRRAYKAPHSSPRKPNDYVDNDTANHLRETHAYMDELL